MEGERGGREGTMFSKVLRDQPRPSRKHLISRRGKIGETMIEIPQHLDLRHVIVIDGSDEDAIDLGRGGERGRIREGGKGKLSR